MAHIKQARLLPRPQMALNMAQIGVLQRHREPGKRHHLGALCNMQLIELGLAQRLRGQDARGISHAIDWETSRRVPWSAESVRRNKLARGSSQSAIDADRGAGSNWSCSEQVKASS